MQRLGDAFLFRRQLGRRQIFRFFISVALHVKVDDLPVATGQVAAKFHFKKTRFFRALRGDSAEAVGDPHPRWIGHDGDAAIEWRTLHFAQFAEIGSQVGADPLKLSRRIVIEKFRDGAARDFFWIPVRTDLAHALLRVGLGASDEKIPPGVVAGPQRGQRGQVNGENRGDYHQRGDLPVLALVRDERDQVGGKREERRRGEIDGDGEKQQPGNERRDATEAQRPDQQPDADKEVEDRQEPARPAPANPKRKVNRGQDEFAGAQHE